MAVTCHTYSKFNDSLTNKLTNLSSDSLKVMLLASYTPAVNAHQFVADVLAAGTETSGTGYTAGGLALSGVSISDSTTVRTLTCSNPVWTGATFSAAYAVFYDATPGTNATNPVFVYWDFGGTQSPSGVPFQLTISGSGLLTLTGTG